MSSWRPTKRNKKQWSCMMLVIAALLFFASMWIVWRANQDTSRTKIQRLDTIGTLVGEMAPDFTVPTLEGDTFTLSAYQGKPVIVFFMAYWCGTCIPEAKALARLKHEYGADVTIIAIDVDPSSSSDALHQFKVASGDEDYVWAFDLAGNVATKWRVRALDTTIILDSDGYIIFRDEKPTDYQTLIQALSGSEG